MVNERVVLNSDLRYLDSMGNLLRSRTELSIARMLAFLGNQYKYNISLKTDDSSIQVDFAVGDKYIEVIDSEADVMKFKKIKEKMPSLNIVAIGHSRYAGRLEEMESMFFYDESERTQSGSIFIEDPSLAFDYAHILP
ncbi:MAG: 6-pyruvoyl tetrahydropterin synthase, partial [Nitrososphaera sp.]|nr:6-pyruvoyl tetrahydropterin synthase [Nitrososphaera sp.]